MRTSTDSGYIITDEPQRLEFAAVHAWLSGSYWSPGITRAQVEQAARHSAVVAGAYQPYGGQVGYCRAVSDRTRFAWVADVYVHPDHRGKGVGRAMVSFLLSHPELADVETWHLGTRDAHGVYAVLGFGPLPHPDRMMQLRRPTPTP
jgi:GNAT superfamily N-acetyltransferase